MASSCRQHAHQDLKLRNQVSISLVILTIYTERVVVSLYTMTTSDHGLIDRLDAALIELLAAEPRVGVLEASRRLRVARGTVQARLAPAGC